MEENVKSKKGGAKGSQDSYPRKSMQRELGKLGSKHAVKFSKGTWHQIKIRERNGPSRGIIPQSVNFMNVVLARQNSEKDHMRRLWTKKDASTKQRGDWRKYYKLKSADKATFFILLFEARVMPAPTSKSSEEREFVVDSGASMHRMSKQDSGSDELDSLRRSRNPTVVLTANGEMHTNEEAQVFVHDLNLCVTVQLLDETPTVLYRLENPAKTTDIPMSGPAVKSHGRPKKGKQLHAQRTTSYLLSFQGYPPVLGASSSTSTSQVLSTIPAQERSDELAPREWCGSSSKNHKQKKEGWQSRCGRSFARSS